MTFMKELLLKLWDECVPEFHAQFGHSQEGDEYIAKLRTKIADHKWLAETTAREVENTIDSMVSFDTAIERSINRELAWGPFLQAMKEALAKGDYSPNRVVDRGYKWYKDYGD